MISHWSHRPSDQTSLNLGSKYLQLSSADHGFVVFHMNGGWDCRSIVKDADADDDVPWGDNAGHDCGASCRRQLACGMWLGIYLQKIYPDYPAYIYIYIYNHIYIYIYLDIRHVATWGCGQMGIGVTSRPKKGGALHPRGLDVISYGFWRIFWNKSMGDHPKLTLNLNLITFFFFFVWLYIYINSRLIHCFGNLLGMSWNMFVCP